MKRQSTPKIVEKKPVAQFWYKGSHTHPVEKVGLVILNKTNHKIITMYVLQDGKKRFPYGQNHIKSFRRDRIAKFGSLRKEVRSRLGITQDAEDISTLVRKNLSDLVCSNS